jgi:hypothetical protein
MIYILDLWKFMTFGNSTFTFMFLTHGYEFRLKSPEYVMHVVFNFVRCIKAIYLSNNKDSLEIETYKQPF